MMKSEKSGEVGVTKRMKRSRSGAVLLLVGSCRTVRSQESHFFISYLLQYIYSLENRLEKMLLFHKL